MKNVTMGGNPVTLPEVEIKVGDIAPNFTVVKNDLSEVTLEDYAGTVRILSVVPSLDTSVCSTQTARFNKEANDLPGVKVLTVSCDLPFAQARWCAAEGLENIVTLSDHKYLAVGEAYGVAIEDLRLLARAVFVIDSAGKVVYVQYVPEVTTEPDYDAALAAAKAAQ